MTPQNWITEIMYFKQGLTGYTILFLRMYSDFLSIIVHFLLSLSCHCVIVIILSMNFVLITFVHCYKSHGTAGKETITYLVILG